MASSSTSDSDTFMSAPENPAHYTKMYQEFLDNSDYRQNVDNWYKHVFPDFVVSNLAPTCSSGSPVRVLAVGSGPGDIDLKMALAIQSAFKKVHETVVEPAHNQNALYHQLLEKTTLEGVRDIEYDFREQRIEEYRQDDTNKGNKFDFISAVHCLYHVDDYDDTVGYLYDCLEDGGILMIKICAETSSYTLVQKKFPQTQVKGMRMITSGDICRSFDKRGIPYEMSNLPIRSDAANYMEESLQLNPSEGTDFFFDFITMMVDVRKQAPKFYRELISFLKDDPHCVRRDAGGKIIFDSDSGIVIVKKKN